MSWLPTDESLEQNLRELPTLHVPLEKRQQEYNQLVSRVRSATYKRKVTTWTASIAAAAVAALVTVHWLNPSLGGSKFFGDATPLSSTQVGPTSTTVAPAANVAGHYVPAPYPPKSPVFANQQALSASDQAKCALLTKMGYAFENIQSMQATYTATGFPANETVQFDLVEGQYPAVREVTTGANGKQTHTVDGAYSFLVFPNGQQQVQYSMPQSPEQQLMQRPFVLKGPGNNNNSYYLPSDPSRSMFASNIVSPLGDLPGGLVDIQNWSIQGHESLLNRSTTVIHGQLDSYFVQKMKAVSYRVWVDDQTGILLKKELYDAKGQVTESLLVTQLNLKPKLDIQEFQIPQSAIEKANLLIQPKKE